MLDGDVDMLERCLAHGADVDARDRYGQTGLMLAAVRGGARVVTCLIAHGADLDHTAKFGLSAIMLAVVNGHADVVSSLARAGADLTLRGTGAPGFNGKTARDLASDRGDTAMVAILDRQRAP